MTKLTLEDIAERAGVSRSTASRALRNQGSVSQRARDRVLRVVEETGFRPNPAARSLTGHRTNIIGFFITEVSHYVLQDPYFGRLIEGVTQSANERDQTLILFLQHDVNDIDRMTARILQNPLVDGLVISSTLIDNPIVPQLLDNNVPFVIVGRHEDPRVSYVDVDNHASAFTAVSYLFRQGCRRIGTVTGSMSNYSAIDRLQGYRDAHRAYGATVDDSLVYLGDYLESSGYIGTRQLLRRNVDAIFAASDAIALGALDAIHEAGLRVPDDIALIGFDDLPFAASAEPPLSTVRQPIQQTGKVAVEILLDLVGNPTSSPQRVSLPTELIVRASSEKPTP